MRAIAATLLLVTIAALAKPAAGGEPEPAFIGSAACGTCHQGEMAAWRTSHHDFAMAEATNQTVLGDFSGVTFTHAGVTSRFFRRDGKFFVHTDGPGGTLRDFEITYVFGVHPLQQYLIAFPNGRMQALGIAWDSRPKDKGGQRWFHLYPDQQLKAGDALHWTGIDQTWNFQCAECHSTELRKGYNAARNTYATTWAEIDVACEACHGPGTAHVAWAKGDRRGPNGLSVQFDERKGVH
ncbi:MAG: multiheme c-type cytochrome [Defluviicoccus sp.]